MSGITCPIAVSADDEATIKEFLQGIYNYAHTMRVTMVPVLPVDEEDRKALAKMFKAQGWKGTFTADIPTYLPKEVSET